jgi:hypothetical protein
VIDITDPQSPQIVGHVVTPGLARGVAVAGSSVYIADGHFGLQILPAHCQGTTPVRMLSLRASFHTAGVLLEWETGSETNHAGFHVYRRVVGFSWARMTTDLIVGGPQYSYSDRTAKAGFRYHYEVESRARTGGTERFGPVELEIPLVTGLTLRAAPNPSTGSTKIQYALPAAGPVSIRMFDLSGRLVRVLVHASQIAGAHEIIWNGADDSGRRVPTGIYFVKLDTEAGSRIQRVTILR